MELVVTVVGLSVVALALLWSWRSGGSGLSVIKGSIESLEKNLMLLQERTERFQQIQSSELRREMQEEMLKNRTELATALGRTAQVIDERVATISRNVSEKLDLNLKEGFNHFEKVQNHLKEAGLQLQHLNSVAHSISDLNNLLKLPHLRGSFGESTLERLLADTLPATSFELQYRIVPNSLDRVDAVVKLPQYVIPIDSKFPREQVLPLFESNDPSEIEAARKVLADIIKGLARQIRDKYVHPEYGTSDMALLFVPSETLYFECLRSPTLCTDMSKLRVFPVSPNTLSVALHSIAIARDYYEMAKGVEKTLSELKRATAHLQNFDTRFGEVGKSLLKAHDSYQVASTHLARYQNAITRLDTGHTKTPEPLPPETNA